MMMKNIHNLECRQCKSKNQFYEDFNCDSEKDMTYFGVISYIQSRPEKELPKEDKSYMDSNICFLQLINEWTVRDLVSKHLKQENGLIPKHLKEKDDLFSKYFGKKKKTAGPKIPFYLPEHTGNLITIKKSESFSGSSPEDSVCSDNLKTTKIVYKCPSTEKSPSKEEVVPKEPKVGTLKRKRWNLEKLKSKESYEDDLFEEKKLKRIRVDDSPEEVITTPIWSVQISPRVLSRSPSYEDCYSLTELQNSRKEAEEYQHRRNKRKKYMSVCKKDDPEAVMKQDPKTYNTLMETCKRVQKLTNKQEEDCISDSEKDHYFSDLEDSDN